MFTENNSHNTHTYTYTDRWDISNPEASYEQITLSFTNRTLTKRRRRRDANALGPHYIDIYLDITGHVMNNIYNLNTTHECW